MTDDEIRQALRLDFEQTADWRRSKAAENSRKAAFAHRRRTTVKPVFQARQRRARTGLPAEAVGWRARARLRQGYGGQPSLESSAKVGAERGPGAPASDGVGGSGGAKPPGKKCV